MGNITEQEIEKLAEDWLYSLEEINPQVLEKKYPLIPMKFGFKEGYKAALQNKVSDISAGEVFKKYAPDAEKLLRITSNKKYREVIAAMEEYASIVNENLLQELGEKEVMIKTFADIQDMFENRYWIMEGRGCYPYDDDRYKEEMRYLYDDFCKLKKDVWENIKTKTFEYRDKIIANYKKSIVNEKDNIPADFKQVTGHDSSKEMIAYEKGREDEQQVITEWIEKWDGSTNSGMGELLNKKFNERKDNVGVWVKASERLPNKLDYYNCRLAGIPVVFWIDHKNEAIISEKGTTMNKILFKSIEWLDESQPQQKEVDVLPTKEEIIAEAKKIYEEVNNSGDFEAVRQSKTAQLMFIAGGFFAKGIRK